MQLVLKPIFYFIMGNLHYFEMILFWIVFLSHYYYICFIASHLNNVVKNSVEVV